MLKISLTSTLAIAAAIATIAPASARDTLSIVGSSTVFPYTVEVAKHLAESEQLAAPEVTSTGTGGGFRLFCAGTGLDTPDITGASRPITRTEWQTCRDNGVDNITEVMIGYDGLTVAASKEAPVEWTLTPRQLYLALAETVPVDGALVANPHQNWSDVDPSLPNIAIRVMGPPKSSGTRDSFEEMALAGGCAGLSEIAALGEDEAESAYTTIRTDGAYMAAGEDDQAIADALKSDPNLLGVFGYAHLYANDAFLRGADVNGVSPSFVTIATGEYPFARPLFLYIKNDHRAHVPGMATFLTEYVGNAALPYGYLVEMGLTPILDDGEREQIAGEAVDGKPMEPPPGS